MSSEAPGLRPAFEALREAKARHARVRPHRALVRLEAGPYLFQTIVLPLFFCALLWRFEPQLVAFWREFILAWAEVLHIPLRASARAAGWGEVRLVWSYFEAESLYPGTTQLLLHGVVTATLFAVTLALPPRMLPAKFLLRVLCVLHGSAIAFFALAPGRFPYDMTDHILATTGGGYVLLMTVPVMLALGYYVLRIPLATKIFHSLLILGYFVVLVPLEVVLHAVIISHFSLVTMPLLFFGFGALLDFVLFIALYAWAASTAPGLGSPAG